MFGFIKDKKGIAVYLVVIVIAAVTLLISLSISKLLVLESQNDFFYEKEHQSFSLADGCMNEAYYRIKQDNNFNLNTSSIEFKLSNGKCIINVDDLGNNLRKVSVTSSINNSVTAVSSIVNITQTSSIQVNSWQEV